MMDFGAVSESNEEEVSRSYTPLSFYMGSTVDYPGPISYMCPTVDHPVPICMSNYIPLSLLPLDSTAYTESNEEKLRNYTESKMVSKLRNYTESKMVSKLRNYTESKMVSKLRNYTESKMVSNEKKLRKSKVNYIPDKISFSILSKLPVKSLKRFESVQKSWSILFENSDFMTMYTDHFISRHRYENSDYHTFLLKYHFMVPQTPDSRNHAQLHLLENRVKLNLPSLFEQHSQCISSILGSTTVNGIFCFGQIYKCKNEVQYVLWNPATEESWVIPPSPTELRPHYPENELYLTHAFHGFGYDQVRDDFKLIQFVRYLPDDDYSPPTSSNFFEIYSLNTNSWRMIDMGIPLSHWAYPPSFYGEEVYLDGACHWLCKRSNNLQRIHMTLLSFDLDDEVFITTPIGVESYSPYTYVRCLTVLNGSIALISNNDDNVSFHISILGELGVSESWIKLYIYGPLPSIKWPPIGFGKTGYLFFTKEDYQLAYVDLSTQIVKELGITGGDTGYFRLGLYKESLYSIGGSRI